MSGIDLTSLGLKPEEIQNLVVERIASQVMRGMVMDEDGDEYEQDSQFARKLTACVREQVDAKVAEVADKHILPHINEFVETLHLQEMSRWGEAKGEPLTFTEYLIARAEAWITEKVNYGGKTNSESGGYSWAGTQTRIAHMIHQHLHHRIEQAMKEALKNANSVLVGGIVETTKLKLAELERSLKVTVETKR